MKKTYQLKTNAIKGEPQVIDIAPATGKAPVTVPAAAGARYELIDAQTRSGPDNIRVQRKGNHLQVFFDGDTEAGVVIEDFYQVHTDSTPTLVGRTDQGTFYEYIPEIAAPSAIVTNLNDTGIAYGVALGGQELAATSGAAIGALVPLVGAFSPLLVGGAALGAAALAGGGGGGGSDSPATPPVATAKLADASDSGTKGDNKTNINTPTILGTAPAGSTTKVNVNGTDYDAKVNADGTLSYDITEHLKDGTYTPVIKVTQNGITTSYDGTPFTIDTQTTVAITDSGLAGTTRVISGTAEAGDTVVVTDVNNKTIGTTTADSSGKWSLTPTSAVAAGTITASATDLVGNTKDAAGNPAVDTGSNLINGGKALGLIINMDTNNDGLINLAEKGNASATNVTVSFDNTKVSAGDVITLGDGATNKTVSLTATDVAAGKVVTTWGLPATEGALLKLTATIKDAAGTANNLSPEASDSATVDVTAPISKDLGLALGIATDVNNDGWINFNELGNATSITSHATFDKTKAKAGDSLVFTATNGTTALDSINHKLTDADITQGFVDVAFGMPANGQAQTVVVNYVDAAGNAAADKVSDTATLDTTVPTNAGVNLALQMTTDANNDGWVNSEELASAATFTSRASFDKAKVAEGESIVFNATNGTTTLPAVTHKLTAADISNGYVDVTFNKPGDGQLQTVKAQYMDKAGNLATDKSTDSATLDTTAPSSLGLTIDLDNGLGTYNNDGRINSIEKKTATTTDLTVSFDKTKVLVGDVITLSDGTTTKTVTLDQGMVDAGNTTSTGWALPAENGTLKVTAVLKDTAGNSSQTAEDSGLIDTTSMVFGNTKTVLDGTAISEVTFRHGTFEKGTYALHVGQDTFTGTLDGVTELSKTFMSASKTVNGTSIYLEFWDAAGNYSTANVPLSQDAVVGIDTKFSTGFIV